MYDGLSSIAVHLYFLRHNVSLNLKLIRLTGLLLVSFRELPVSASLVLELHFCAVTLAFYMGSGVLNSELPSLSVTVFAN